MMTLRLPNGIEILKYYGGSYRPKDSCQIGFDSIYIQLLGIDDKYVFEQALSQRCLFTNLDVTHQISCRFHFDFLEDFFPLTFPQLTMLHAALMFKPDFFTSILNKVPIAKLPALMAEKLAMPKVFFSQDAAVTDKELYTLASFAKELKSEENINLLLTGIDLLLKLKNNTGFSDELLQKLRFDFEILKVLSEAPIELVRLLPEPFLLDESVTDKMAVLNLFFQDKVTAEEMLKFGIESVLEESKNLQTKKSVTDKSIVLSLSFQTKVPVTEILKLSIKERFNFLKKVNSVYASSSSSFMHTIFSPKEISASTIINNIHTKEKVLQILRDVYAEYSTCSDEKTEQKKEINDLISRIENNINFLENPKVFLTKELTAGFTFAFNNPFHQALSQISNAIKNDKLDKQFMRDVLNAISTQNHLKPRQ